MKKNPIIHRKFSPPTEITRADAAQLLRHDRRHHGRPTRSSDTYILKSENSCLRCPHPEKRIPVSPPRTFSLSCRTTRKYVAGWSHLDDHHDLGTCQIIDQRESHRKDSESFRRMIILEVDASVARYRPRNIVRAIEDSFAHGCRCEHDCCGHVQAYVTGVRRLCRNRYAAWQSCYRNV